MIFVNEKIQRQNTLKNIKLRQGDINFAKHQTLKKKKNIAEHQTRRKRHWRTSN